MYYITKKGCQQYILTFLCVVFLFSIGIKYEVLLLENILYVLLLNRCKIFLYLRD